jgi:GNAT superfamily N-acetyltransferase
MVDSLDVRPYRDGDECAILRLFEQCYGKPMSLNYWDWRFKENPLAGPLVVLAWDGDLLAAHYAVSPVALELAGESVKSALSMTTMTHPAYRRRGLFARLAIALYDRMQETGYQLVWGFPNEQSHRGFVSDLDWVDICEIPMFRLGIENLDSTPSPPSQVVERAEFDAGFDRLWEQVRFNHMVAVKRDSTYLTWRYCRHPQNQYRILSHVEGGETLGYVVFKRYGQDADIVDTLTIGDTKVHLGLIHAVMRISAQEGAKHLNMWLPLRTAAHVELERVGFTNEAPIAYLGARVLGSLSPDRIGDARNWHYSMGDADLF